MKDLVQNKAPGFRVTIVAILFALVTAIVYAVIYSRTRFMSWAAFGMLIAGAVLAFLLILAKLYRFAPAVLMFADFMALWFYVYNIYFFISSVVTGIQFSGFPPEFFVNIVFFVITTILGVCCVFMPQTKEG